MKTKKTKKVRVTIEMPLGVADTLRKVGALCHLDMSQVVEVLLALQMVKAEETE